MFYINEDVFSSELTWLRPFHGNKKLGGRSELSFKLKYFESMCIAREIDLYLFSHRLRFQDARKVTPYPRLDRACQGSGKRNKCCRAACWHSFLLQAREGNSESADNRMGSKRSKHNSGHSLLPASAMASRTDPTCTRPAPLWHVNFLPFENLQGENQNKYFPCFKYKTWRIFFLCLWS